MQLTYKIYFVLAISIIESIGLTLVVAPTPTVKQILSHPHFELAGEEDYLDEIRFGGPRIRDTEKFERQKNCKCLQYMKDVHCGSDDKEYDNGCYFLCAQERTPGLTLKRWGSCSGDDNEGTDDLTNNSITYEDLDFVTPIDEDDDYDNPENTPMGYIES